jgi:hypothetical protein
MYRAAARLSQERLCPRTTHKILSIIGNAPAGAWLVTRVSYFQITEILLFIGKLPSALCLKKQPDTVGESSSAENWASHMPLLQVQEPGESNAAIAAVSRGNRFANSIRAVFKTDDPSSCLSNCRNKGIYLKNSSHKSAFHSCKVGEFQRQDCFRFKNIPVHKLGMR